MTNSLIARAICICAAFMLLFAPPSRADLSAAPNLEAYQLLDDTTGKPIMSRPNGDPEAWIIDASGVVFLGVFTGAKVVPADQHPPVFLYPGVRVGSTFQSKETGQRIRVAEWCCYRHDIDLPSDSPSDTMAWRLEKELEQFGLTPDGDVDTISLRNLCVPFTYLPIFSFDSKTHRLRWARFFAAKHKGWDDRFQNCADESPEVWLVFDQAAMDAALDSQTLLARLEYAGNRTLLFAVDAETGEVVGPNPNEIKAIPVDDVIRFKGAFLRTHPCPLMTAREKESLGSVTVGRYTKTPAGRCFISRLAIYQESLINHFFVVRDGSNAPNLRRWLIKFNS